MLGRELTKGGQLDRARAEREVRELSRNDRARPCTPIATSPTCPSAKRSASRSSRRSIAARRFSFSTSRPRCCRRRRSTSSGRCCAQMRARGETIVLITHKLDEVMEISDTITVMRQGATVGRMRTAEHDARRDRESDGRPRRAARDGLRRRRAARDRRRAASTHPRPPTPLLDVRDLVVDRRAAARRGERRELRRSRRARSSASPASKGNGQTELLEAIAGLRDVRSGRDRHRPARHHRAVGEGARRRRPLAHSRRPPRARLDSRLLRSPRI